MKLLLSLILTAILFLASGCVRGSVQRADTVEPNSARVLDTSKPQRIPLPFSGQKLVLLGSDILIIGYGELARFDPKSGAAPKASLMPMIDRYLSINGGVSFLDGPVSEDAEDLCSSDNAVYASDRLYSIGVCEHTGQFWNFDFSGRKSYTIDFTYSTYPNSDTNDAVYFPRDIAVTDTEVLLASNLRNGPAVQVVDPSSAKLVTKWRGGEEYGNLISFSFVRSHGWLLTSVGIILESFDGGKTWQPLPTVSKNADIIRFRNEREGFVIGAKGLVLRTTDAGRTWFQDVVESTSSFIDIVQNDDHAAIRDIDGAIWMKSSYSKFWTKLSEPDLKPATDQILLDDALYLLIEDELVKIDLPMEGR